MAKRHTTYYVARYEDAAKIRREATRIGWTEGDGSLLDELDCNDFKYLTGRVFNERRDALAWLTERINAGKTFFGCGDIIEMVTVKSGNRCRYCTCDGEKQERRWRVEVDSEGAGDLCDERHYDDCWGEYGYGVAAE